MSTSSHEFSQVPGLFEETHFIVYCLLSYCDQDTWRYAYGKFIICFKIDIDWNISKLSDKFDICEFDL